MTAQKYLDKHVPRRYFTFILRQNWPVLVTNAIVLLIVNFLILSLNLSDTVSSYTEISFTEARLINFLNDYVVLNVVVSSLLAVLWGCSTMSYVNSKVGVHFYHSLPLKRESLYLQEVGARILWFITPMLVSCVFGLLTVGAVSGMLTGGVLLVLGKIFLYSTVYFLVFYAIMIFAASFTGTGFARLLAAGMIVFMPAILVLCVYLIFDYGAFRASYEWISEGAAELLLPYRAVIMAADSSSSAVPLLNPWLEIPCTLLLAAGFLALGCVIYKRRKSELSGTPVLSKIAAGVMKYSAMFAAITLVALLMEDLTDGLGLFIGAVIGGVLSMMLMNTILTKSAKRMFSGVRGGIICCLAFFLAFAVFGLDMIGLDTYVPSASSVRSVSVRISNVGTYELKFEDDEDIARITEIVKQYLSDESAFRDEREVYVTATESKMKYGNLTQKEEFEQDLLRQTSYMMNDSMYVRVSFRTVGGLRLDKNYDAVINGTHFELLAMMANHEDFKDAYFGDDDTYVDGAWVDIERVDFPAEEFHGLKYKYKSDEARAIWEKMRSSYNGMEWFNRPGLAGIHINDAPNFDYPYYDGTDAAVNIYADRVDSIQVVNAKTGVIREYTGLSEIRQILAAGVRNYSRVSAYTPKDDTYVFFVQLDDEDWQYSFSAYFLKDHLPPISLP